MNQSIWVPMVTRRRRTNCRLRCRVHLFCRDGREPLGGSGFGGPPGPGQAHSRDPHAAAGQVALPQLHLMGLTRPHL